MHTNRCVKTVFEGSILFNVNPNTTIQTKIIDIFIIVRAESCIDLDTINDNMIVNVKVKIILHKKKIPFLRYFTAVNPFFLNIVVDRYESLYVIFLFNHNSVVL